MTCDSVDDGEPRSGPRTEYGFALGRVESDGIAETAGTVKTDALIGVGPGYRVINTPDLSWWVQPGIGVSYLKYGLGASETETGYIASSRLFWRIKKACSRPTTRMPCNPTACSA